MGNTHDANGRKVNGNEFAESHQRTSASDATSRHPGHPAQKWYDVRTAQEYESLCNVHRYLETLKTKLDQQRVLASELMGLSNHDLRTIIHRLKSWVCRLEKSCEDYRKLIFTEESKLRDCIREYDGDWKQMRQVFVDSLMMRQEATKGLQSYLVDVTWLLDQFLPLREFISCAKSTNIEVDMVVGSYLKVVGPHRQHTEDEYPGKDEGSCLSNEFKKRVGLIGPNRSILVDASVAVQDADAAINRSKLLIRQTEACCRFFVEADKLSVSFFTEIESLCESKVNSSTVEIMKQIKCDSDLMCRTIDDIVSGFGIIPGLAHDNECSVVECKCASFGVEIPKLWENHFYCLNILKKDTDILEAMLREINTKAQTCELIKMEYAKNVEEANLHYLERVNGLYAVTVGQLDNGFVASDECDVTRNLSKESVQGICPKSIFKQDKLPSRIRFDLKTFDTCGVSNTCTLLSTERGDNNSVRLYMDMFSRCDAFVEKVEQLGQFDMMFSGAPTAYRDVSDNVKKFKTIVQSYVANVRRFYGAVADQHNLGFNASPEKTHADINLTNRRTLKTVTFKSSPVFIERNGASVVKLSNNLISESLKKYCVCQLRFIRAKLPSLRFESQAAIIRAIDKRVNFCEHILVARQDVIFNRDLFNCSICLSDVQPGDGLVLSECLHTFCRVCLNHYVRASATETASVTCPFVYSDLSRCSGFINHREMKSFFSYAEYESVLELSLRITERGLKNSFHCGNPSCDFWAVVEYVLPRQLCFLYCPKCDQSTCLKCSQIHNILFDCEKQLQRINDQNLMRNEEYVKKKLLDKVAMECPGCGVVIEKNGGCENMTCIKCKQTFKWTGRAS